MKAAQLVAPKRWEFTEVETPAAADGQVLVKMERVSVCGSDIRHTYGPVLDESEYPLAPCRGAHELAGVIVDSKTDEYHEGQRVIVIPFPAPAGFANTSFPPRGASPYCPSTAAWTNGSCASLPEPCSTPAGRSAARCSKTS